MKIHQLKAGVILSYISLFLGNIISIVYTPIMLGLLGQNEYGLYQLADSIIAYLGLLTFGLGSAYIRFYAIYKKDDNVQGIAKLNGMFLLLFTLVGVVACLCGLSFTITLPNIFGTNLTASEIELSQKLMIVLAINIGLSFPFSIFTSYTTAHERYVFQRLLEIGRIISSPLVTYPLLLMGYGSMGLAFVTTGLNIAIGIFYIVYSIKKLHMKFIFRDFNFPLLKEMLIFSSFIFINIIVDKINWNVDKFLLGIYQGSVAIAVYSIAAQLNTYYLNFSISIAAVFTPKINALVHEAQGDALLNELFIKVGRIQCIVLSLILSGLFFFGKPFIELWIGKEYTMAYTIMLILVTPVTIPLMQTLGIEIQRAKNLHKFRAYLYLGIALANLAISIPLTKAYSGIGSAMGTAMALFVGNGIIMNIYYHKKCGINVIAFWKEIATFIPALILPIASGLLMLKYADIDSWLWLIFYIGVYTCIFTLSMWFLGLNSQEKALVPRKFKKS